jgi:DNA-binding CsgD family transcriptional regulator
VFGTGWFRAVAAETGRGKIRSTRPGGHVGYVGVTHDVEVPGDELFFTHVHLHGGPAPVRRLLPDLVHLIWNRKIDPGNVFDLTLPLHDVAEGYKAMGERRAIKVAPHRLTRRSTRTTRSGPIIGAVQAQAALPLLAQIERLAARARIGLATGAVDEQAAPFGLTDREQQVLTLVAAGHTNRQIADQLYMSVKTASVHVSHILAKVGVASRGQAAAVAHRLGLGD